MEWAVQGSEARDCFSGAGRAGCWWKDWMVHVGVSVCVESCTAWVREDKEGPPNPL